MICATASFITKVTKGVLHGNVFVRGIGQPRGW